MTEATLAGQILHTFEKLKVGQTTSMQDAWAALFNVAADSPEYFTCLAAVKHNLDRLEIEVAASSLNPKSKKLSTEAVHIFRSFTSMHVT